MLPSVASRAMDHDADLNLDCLVLLRYAELFHVFERGKKEEIERHADSPLMKRVIQNAHALVEKQIVEGPA